MTQISFDRPADVLRAKFNADVERIKARHELTQVAKQALLAAALKNAKSQMTELESTANEARQSARAKNERTAFGLDDLASTPGDKALVAMAHRAAAEKVATIKSPQEAGRLLAKADSLGDETMARAIAQHADALASVLGSDEWQGVLNNYASSRPAAFKAIETLLAERLHRPQGAEMFEYVLVSPIELGRASDGDLDRMIAQNPFARA